MNFKTVLAAVVTAFCLFCGILVIKSGIFEARSGDSKPCILLQSTTGGARARPEKAEEQKPQLQSAEPAEFTAANAPAKKLRLGSTDPNSGFKFLLELTSKGAAIEQARLSEFDNLDPQNPQPLVLLSAVRLAGNRQLSSMANTTLVLPEYAVQLPLDKLDWKSFPVQTADDGSESVRFEALIKDKADGGTAIRLTKTYRLRTNSYDLDCELAVENLTARTLGVRTEMTGPVGIAREDVRRDSRKAAACFRGPNDRLQATKVTMRSFDTTKSTDSDVLDVKNAQFLWAAATNKYFAAVVVPMPEQGKKYCDWITGRRNKTGDRQVFVNVKKGMLYSIMRTFTGKSYEQEKTGTGKTVQLFNPDKRGGTDDENIAIRLDADYVELAGAGKPQAVKNYKFKLYLGPKDKSIFDKNELYKELGFLSTIDFMPCCCCPAAIINPLAFGILALMRWLYFFIPNYGVVIIIFVFVVRLALHPLSKKSQVSMSKMGKLAPMTEQIKKKYANDKAELNRQMMALYKEHGASPIMGMLPMFVQMPVWIALYSAIYASIALRGASFLPFWITDLSAPDALFRFKAVTLPLFGKLDSFNLLPIMMGVAFYLQQKLMPSQATASSSPQVAQQQKMMMVMMPILFPLMLYKAPSGLNLYIMSSVFAGVIEQYVIKKHIREKQQAEAQSLVPVTKKTGGKVKKKKPKPFYKM